MHLSILICGVIKGLSETATFFSPAGGSRLPPVKSGETPTLILQRIIRAVLKGVVLPELPFARYRRYTRQNLPCCAFTTRRNLQQKT